MKKLLCVLLCVSMLLGFSGCGFVEGIKSYQNRRMIETLIEYLEDKYDEEFEMVKFVKRFNGNYGVHYFGTYQSLERPDMGTIYLLQEGNERLTQRKINGKTWYIRDDYALVMFGSQYAEGLQEILGEDVVVRCNIRPYDVQLTQEEFDAGLKAYLEVEDSYRRVPYVYVFADVSRAEDDLRTAAEAYMSQYNASEQGLWVIYSWCGLSTLEELYEENRYNLHNMMDDEVSRWADRIEVSYFERDAGVTERKIIKE